LGFLTLSPTCIGKDFSMGYYIYVTLKRNSHLNWAFCSLSVLIDFYYLLLISSSFFLSLFTGKKPYKN
jgi:hypothetical protein